MQDRIIELFTNKPDAYTPEDYRMLQSFIDALNTGSIRACELQGEEWIVHQWVKMGILLGFRMGNVVDMSWSENKPFFDKHTLPEKQLRAEDQIRIVPGGSSARTGCYIAPGVTIMPPAFINVGAYVDRNTMVDSHALVGSCAQIGKNVHLSAGAMIGGVLEPIGSRPVVIEDDVFVGGNTGIYEGIIVKSRAVLASGTIITSGTPIYDAVNGCYLPKDSGNSYTIPSGAVLVPGSRALKGNADFHAYCPIIIKYRDDKTDASTQLEQDLRAVLD